MPDLPDIIGLRQGFLYKRKKKSDEWNSRYFILDTENLSYYINSQVISQADFAYFIALSPLKTAYILSLINMQCIYIHFSKYNNNKCEKQSMHII